ncbi:SH3 domain-containing protein [bacterium]|nr:SH3 domain-containing protein [bacterium]
MQRVAVRFFFCYLIIFGLFVGWAETSLAVKPVSNGVIRVSKANVRKAPDKRSPRIFSLRRKYKVKILQERDGWLYIATAKGRRGWVSKSLIKVLKPPKVKPKIEVFSNDLNVYQETFIHSLVARMRSQLATVEPQPLEFLVSKVVASGEKSTGLAGAGSVTDKDSGFWLLMLRYPFSRVNYQQEQATDLTSGTVDLLLYHDLLRVILDTRELLVSEIKKNAGRWSVSRSSSAAVKILLVLRSENGDQIGLGGFRESGFPVFDDSMILEIHGFSPFTIHASLPANVTEFNKFDLPSPYLHDGNRSTAALAHDFFGFSY